MAGFLDYHRKITILNMSQGDVKGNMVSPVVNVTQFSTIQKLINIRKPFSTKGRKQCWKKYIMVLCVGEICFIHLW